jgi:hypothetical protein
MLTFSFLRGYCLLCIKKENMTGKLAARFQALTCFKLVRLFFYEQGIKNFFTPTDSGYSLFIFLLRSPLKQTALSIILDYCY